MLVYHTDFTTYSDTSEEDAFDFARDLAWGEVECSEQEISHKHHIKDIDGVGVWYCYGADHYFFTNELPLEEE